MLRDWWLKLGCFLTGHNYGLVKNSSEASAKSVKKYVSAILIISLLWAFIGYSFANRYLKADTLISVIVALVMVIVVIQIERQIILNTSINRWPKFFRGIIALVMAIIGSVIIDQILFREDVEKLKIADIQTQVDLVVPARTKIISNQIRSLDSLIKVKELEKAELQLEYNRNPQINSVVAVTREEIVKKADSMGVLQDKKVRLNDFTKQQIPNPIGARIPVLEEQISDLRKDLSAKEGDIINIRTKTEEELSSKTGFLDEISTLFKIIFSSVVAGVVWVCIFLFFFSIELFVLISKSYDSENDYDRIVLHQKDMRFKMLAKLASEK